MTTLKVTVDENDLKAAKTVAAQQRTASSAASPPP